ncbi:4-alpha-glucanotransferase, partial [Aquibium sp. A9E412]|uniref:4-alpha-glucanotransferase n=1 Tax=Aquibium sp. A9E412 TaxID=2976767 RepID=UPI0025AF8819
MPQSLVDQLARRYGIVARYTGFDGEPVHVPRDSRRRLLAGLGLDVDDEAALAAALAAAPAAAPRLGRSAAPPCHVPDDLAAHPAWGITLQLYELRSARNWGIGDFEDLAVLGELAARAGADFIGLTPLHAPFLAAPERCSPFSPSNRRFLNPLYIAIDRVPGYTGDLAAALPLERLRAAELVDYAAVAAVKRPVLAALWRRWRDDLAAARPELASAFARFREEGGRALERHALFEAISARMAETGAGAGWHGWPERLHDPDGAAAAAFAREHADAVSFHAWLQWLADSQLARAADRLAAAGMRVGLYLDLAVGEAPDGSAVWGARHQHLTGATVGAPPDYFTSGGQDWGVAGLSPLALVEDDGAAWAELVARAARHAGALRIDHVMALWQLFFIPAGARPADGAYVRFPIARILERLAAQSHAARVTLIGEDLGLVPAGFRGVMREAGILSYRVFYFEKAAGAGFRAARAYPRQALACLSTHDLPTLRGWWRGSDVALR